LWGELDKALEMLQKALSLVEPARENDRRAILLRLAMVHEGKGELEKPRLLLDEVLQIDQRLGIPDDDDREHRQRLGETVNPVAQKVEPARVGL
jgi:hypothetical protein